MTYLYNAFTRDKRFGTNDVSNFINVIKQHQFVDQIIEISKNKTG